MKARVRVRVNAFRDRRCETHGSRPLRRTRTSSSRLSSTPRLAGAPIERTPRSRRPAISRRHGRGRGDSLHQRYSELDEVAHSFVGDRVRIGLGTCQREVGAGTKGGPAGRASLFTRVAAALTPAIEARPTSWMSGSRNPC